MNGFTLCIHSSFYPNVPSKVREQEPSSIYSWKTRPTVGEWFVYRWPGHVCRQVLNHVALKQSVSARAPIFLDWLLAVRFVAVWVLHCWLTWHLFLLPWVFTRPFRLNSPVCRAPRGALWEPAELLSPPERLRALGCALASLDSNWPGSFWTWIDSAPESFGNVHTRAQWPLCIADCSACAPGISHKTEAP